MSQSSDPEPHLAAGYRFAMLDPMELGKRTQDQPRGEEYVPPYEGNDMIGFMMSQGFSLKRGGVDGHIVSMANVRDTAIIVTEWAVWRVHPYPSVGFAIERLAVL